MIDGKRVLCVVPARGGSKGLPGKNLALLGGKPLLAHTVGHALASRYVDRTVVSTDDPRIAFAAREAGAEVPFVRPAGLATDTAGTIEVLVHAADEVERADAPYDILLLLHVTTPLRSPADVDGCLELLASSGADNVFSVTEAHRNPYFNMVEVAEDGTVALVKQGAFKTRQEAPEVFDMNSSIYAWRLEALRRDAALFSPSTKVFVMPKERSVDIDERLDLVVAEALLAEMRDEGAGE